jgi:predicted AAA+ superfamily ATPase
MKNLQTLKYSTMKCYTDRIVTESAGEDMLTEEGYLPRIIDRRIDDLLRAFGAVCIEGSKWCGKTWTSLNHANSVYYVGDPAGDYQSRRLAELDPLYALEGEIPHLVDEWQEVPGLWDATRFVVDRSKTKGRFLLTGSSVPPEISTVHTGTGRIYRLRMRPMSLAESGASNGAVSLTRLFEGEFGRYKESINLDTIIRLASRGGWPGALDLDEQSALEIPSHYIDETANRDMSRVDKKKRNPHRVRRLLYSLARNNMTMPTNATLIKDVLEDGSLTGFSEPTLVSYLSILKKLFVIEELPVWAPKLRSRSRIRVSAKKHFVDPSLAIASLGATPGQLRSDLNTFGFMFENMVIRDLKIYAEALGAKVFHYRDDEGLEADAVIEMPDGRWAAIEVKLGVTEADTAARSLLSLEKKITRAGGVPPVFKAAICGVCDFSYVREDGIFVIPITALGA